MSYPGCWNRCTEFHAACHPPIGVCERALFVLDRQGIIAWSYYCSPIAVNPGADEIADALEKLSDQAKSHGQLENADHAGGIWRLRMQHCALAHPVVNQVRRHFGGRMRLVFRHFPLTEVHPHAEGAEFAGAAGLFWEMHDALFANQSRLSIPTIFLIAEELGLPETAMRDALETGQYRN